jgi:hypothetical protein
MSNHNIVDTKYGMLVLPVNMRPEVRELMAMHIEADIAAMLKGMKDYEVESREIQELRVGKSGRPASERWVS